MAPIHRRKFFAEISLDENIMYKVMEYDDMTPTEWFEQECGWIESSGFALEKYEMADEDNEDLHSLYRYYVIDLALTSPKEGSPLSFEEWKDTRV